MNEDRFQHDLHLVLHEIAGGGAPPSLRYRLADVTERAPLGHRQWFPAPLRFATAIVALVVVAFLAFLLVPGGTLGPAATGSPTPSVSPSPTLERFTVADEPTPPVSPTPATSPTLAWSVCWSSLTGPSGSCWRTGSSMEDLVPWGGGYVAWVGSTRDRASTPRFFTSGDGTTGRS